MKVAVSRTSISDNDLDYVLNYWRIKCLAVEVILKKVLSVLQDQEISSLPIFTEQV